MRRLALLLPLLAGLLACNDSTETTTAPEEPAVRQGEKPRAVESPTTGISDVQDGHDSVKSEIRKLEARKQSGEPVEEWLVKNQLKLVDNLIRACEMAIPEEARMDVQKEYGRLRQKESILIGTLGEVGQEISEIRGMLDEARKGVGKIPEGFTEEELEDNLGDLQEKARGLHKEHEELKKEMKKREDLLAQETIEPRGESMFSRELADLKETRKRAEALQS